MANEVRYVLGAVAMLSPGGDLLRVAVALARLLYFLRWAAALGAIAGAVMLATGLVLLVSA